ncbi:uncharacterized protein BKA78DRAFT_173586 [Phyllosticta capitalensis]|uniref:uncharacterized protein n=1 Tax=Phyllosticta capitalensis TaxID=121624 RepID=UPI0031325EB9
MSALFPPSSSSLRLPAIRESFLLYTYSKPDVPLPMQSHRCRSSMSIAVPHIYALSWVCASHSRPPRVSLLGPRLLPKHPSIRPAPSIRTSTRPSIFCICWCAITDVFGDDYTRQLDK